MALRVEGLFLSVSLSKKKVISILRPGEGVRSPGKVQKNKPKDMEGGVVAAKEMKPEGHRFHTKVTAGLC